MKNPLKTPKKLVRVSYHQFYIAEPELFASDAIGGTRNGLLSTEPGIVVVRTGIASGNVSASVELHEEAPPVDVERWQEAVEVSLETVDGEVTVRCLEDDPPDLPVLTPEGPGWYRLRVHARGRDNAVDLAVSEPVEDYLIQIWPAPQRPDETHKQSDNYGKTLRRGT